jgi:hypothetical protein
MDLLPHNVRAALERFPLGSQDGRGMDALVVVKYFFPAGRYTLYVTEAEFDGDDAQMFGYCLSPFGEDCDEWGYAMLSELQSVERGGLTIEFFPYPDLDPLESSFGCCLRLDELTRFYDACKAAGLREAHSGIPRIVPAKVENSGLLIAYMVDPEGSLIRLVQNA